MPPRLFTRLSSWRPPVRMSAIALHCAICPSDCVCAADGTLPQWAHDERGAYLLGQTMRGLLARPPAPQRQELWRRLAAAPTLGRPVVRSLAIDRSSPQCGESGRAVTLRVRATACVDSAGEQRPSRNTPCTHDYTRDYTHTHTPAHIHTLAHEHAL